MLWVKNLWWFLNNKNNCLCDGNNVYIPICKHQKQAATLQNNKVNILRIKSALQSAVDWACNLCFLKSKCYSGDWKSSSSFVGSSLFSNYIWLLNGPCNLYAWYSLYIFYLVMPITKMKKGKLEEEGHVFQEKWRRV
jgi:hypothetical protein